ncbi:hypothetical protein [Streptomyces sp. NPDC101132]|uniref:hypothetical protein n=1 Tax=Streptomyces sp. NPDC101132 TaxID=3366110 RepID=UPI00380C10A8
MARHRKPPAAPALLRRALAAVPPAQRLAAGLALASALSATAVTAFVDPAAPAAPDRSPAGTSSLAQFSRD